MNRLVEQACRNVHRRKRVRAASILLTLSLIFCIGGQCVVKSLCAGIDKLDRSLPGRSIIVDDDKEHTVKKQLEETYKNSDEVEYIYPFTYVQSGDIIQADGATLLEGMGCEMWAYHPGLTEYICEGENREPENGEILLPQYMFDEFDVNNGEYQSGEEFVGTDLVIKLENSYNGNEKEYQFNVIGTYDNINVPMGNSFYVSSEIAEEMMEFSMEDMNSEENLAELLEEMQAEYPGEEIVVGETEVMYYVAVCLKDRGDVDNFIDEYGGIRQLEVADEVLDYFIYLGFIADIMTVFLFIAAFVQLVLATIHEARERKREIALWRTMGYSGKEVLTVAGLEYTFHALRSYLIAVAVSVAIMFAGNYMIQNWMVVSRRGYHLALDGSQMLLGLGMAMMLPVCAVIVTYMNTRKIQMAATLKEKE